MFIKKRIAATLVASILCFSMLLSSCTPAPGNTSSTGSAGTDNTVSGDSDTVTTGNYPGTTTPDSVAINISTEPPEMFSITTTDTVSFNILRHMMEGLTIMDEKDQPIPGVAEKWTISEDGLVYTFDLRKDYKWSNGEAVTANDFVFAFKSLLDPAFAASYSYFGYVFKNGEEFATGKAKFEEVGVKALDDYKLELTLENPTPYLLSMLSFGAMLPLNEKGYKEFGELYGTEADKMVTNGAYNFTSWAHESEIVLTKNPDYPKAENVKIGTIVMKMIVESNAAMNAFKSGELDMMIITGEQRAQMQAENQPIMDYDDASCWYLEFNTKVPKLANANLRKAIAYAIDSESYVKNVVKNDSYPLSQFTPRLIAGNKDFFYNELGPQFTTHDLEAAKAELELAKKALGTETVEVSFLIDDGDVAAKLAAFLQENLQKELGIKMNIEVVPFKARIERQQNNDFEIVLAGWGPDYNDPMTFLDLFESGNGNNHTSYSNPAYDELLDKARVEVDRDTRFGYLMEIEKLLMQDMPIAPFYGRVRDYILSSKLTGVVRTGFQDFNLIGAQIQ